MIFLYILLIYISICIILSSICVLIKNKDKILIFKMPRNKVIYYILSFTWGLPMNLIGSIIALCLIIAGHKPVKYGWNYCFEFDIDWGLELGIFFIAPRDSIHTKNHEHGHGIQNIYLGIFTIGTISIPSVIRFWYREIREKLGYKNKTTYDSIWFEGSASRSGDYFINSLK